MKNKFKILIISLMIILSVFSVTMIGCGAPKQDGPVKESTLSISSFEIKVEKGKMAQLFAGYDGVTEIKFVSSDNNIMTVSVNNGVAEITGVNEGVAYLTISAATQTKTCKVIVYVSEYVINFDRAESETEVWVGTKLGINATVVVDGKVTENVVSWSVVSGNCTIVANGNYAEFTFIQTGNVTIKATFDNNVEKLISFVVTDTVA